MKRSPVRSVLTALIPLTFACATDSGGTSAGPSVDPGSAAVAVPPVEVDDSAPMALDKWRTIKAEGKTAAKTQDLAKRIESCREFVQKYGDHQEVGPVLEALTEAMVEQGDYDVAELAKFLEQRCDIDPDSTKIPMELVREYHVKHGLPVDSAVRMLDTSRERIGKKWKEVELETNERRREWRELSLHNSETKTHTLEGRVYLGRGQSKKALQAFGRAAKKADSFAKDIAVVDDQGKTVRMLGAGVLDELHVLTAAAHAKVGDNEAAKASLARAVGFVSDSEVRGIYAETRTKLGLTRPGEKMISAAALPAQNFKLKDLDGKAVSLSDYKGKVVLVTFWATWCGPCKKELPELQKFIEQNKKKGVELLAISVDSFTDRSKIKPFLKKRDLDFKVLLQDPEQLSSYNYRGIPALYVIDREGKIAHARTGYDPDLKEKLATEIKNIVDGSRESARDLFSIELAPSGFDVLWKQPVTGDASAVAVAPPLGKAPGEVGIVGRKGLMRWSADGSALGAKPIVGWTASLDAADLDGNGTREWVIGGWQTLKVLDQAGEVYWEHKTSSMTEVAGILDFNGDGFNEIVFKDKDRAVVMKAVPEPLWKSHPFKEMETVRVDPRGLVIVQADGVVTELDGQGKVAKQGAKAPEGRTLSGRLDTGSGFVDLFEGRWDPTPHVEHDIDGDGRLDVVIAGHGGVVAYDASGNQILRIRSNDVGISAGIGDLDGKPGDELALFVDHYGLVVLGRGAPKRAASAKAAK